MEKSLTSCDMMEAHINLNLGVYFDNLRSGSSFNVATSETIGDFYWNYAYLSNFDLWNAAKLEDVIAFFEGNHRKPAIWQLSTILPPTGWSVQSHETWMWQDKARWVLQPTETKSSLLITEEPKPTEAMKLVFEDAYSSDAQEGDVGYFRLPPEYGSAYINSRPHPPTTIRHFAGCIDGECVSIATAVIWNDIGGLYSVATKHDSRRQGFGIELSKSATDWAFNNGAKTIILQTEADSAVEKMYEKLGFCRSHIGTLLTQD